MNEMDRGGVGGDKRRGFELGQYMRIGCGSVIMKIMTRESSTFQTSETGKDDGIIGPSLFRLFRVQYDTGVLLGIRVVIIGNRDRD